jgi:molybdenum cofactor biosynthesis protein MoaC
MKSVTSKPTTLRRASATARVKASADAVARMRANDLPKKDVLVVARVAGVTAAKNTPDLIPYCHPIPVDSVEIDFVLGEATIDITATVEAIWKTGVEMEALTAATAAALTVYDMLKPVDTNLEISSVRLVEKRGGKSDFRERIPEGFVASVIVTSDGTHAGTRKDRSGQVIRERLESFGIDTRYHIVPDDADRIESLVRNEIDTGASLVLTTGGTGLGPRDVTVEATRPIIEREIPGVMEASRSHGQSRTPYAMLSRGLAGVCGGSIIVNLPGSSKGATEALDAIFPAILHGFAMIRGGGHG